MGVQRLSAKKIRKIASVTGLDVVRGWANGGYTFWFATSDHIHGRIDTKTDEWQFDTDHPHLTSCYDSDRNLLFPLPEFEPPGTR